MAVLESPLTPVVAVFLLAAVVEAIVEYFIAPLVEPLRNEDSNGKAAKWRLMALRYISLCFGVALAVLYDADLLRILGVTTVVPYAGSVLTGLLMGRGSNWLHEFASRYLAKQ